MATVCGRERIGTRAARPDCNRRCRRDHLLQAWTVARSRVRTRAQGDIGGVRGRRHQPPRDRRILLLQQRPQHTCAAGQRARPPRAAVFEHAVGRRGRRRSGGRAERRWRSARGLSERCSGLPGACPRTVRPLRPRRASPCGARRVRLHAPLWRDEPGPDVRHAHHPADARPQHRPVDHASGGAGRVPPRTKQPSSGDVRPPARRADLRFGALDH